MKNRLMLLRPLMNLHNSENKQEYIDSVNLYLECNNE